MTAVYEFSKINNRKRKKPEAKDTEKRKRIQYSDYVEDKCYVVMCPD